MLVAAPTSMKNYAFKSSLATIRYYLGYGLANGSLRFSKTIVNDCLNRVTLTLCYEFANGCYCLANSLLNAFWASKGVVTLCKTSFISSLRLVARRIS